LDNGCIQKVCCNESILDGKRTVLKCEKSKPERCPVSTFEKCKEITTRPGCTRKQCFKYTKTGDDVVSNGCYMSGKEVCIPTEKNECKDRAIGRNCKRQWCCKVRIVGGVKKTVLCSWNGQKRCDPVIIRKCTLVDTKRNCKRTRCCRIRIQEGQKPETLRCKFRGPQICNHIPPVKKCSWVGSGSLCKKKQCCLWRWTRDEQLVKIENSCVWGSKEVCETTVFTKCFHEVTRLGCKRRKCCKYEKKGKEIKIKTCTEGPEFCELVPCGCPKKTCDCETKVKVVCGDGKTYQNECVAQCAGAIKIVEGRCPPIVPPVDPTPSSICRYQYFRFKDGKCTPTSNTQNCKRIN